MATRSSQRPAAPKPPVQRRKMFDLDTLEREGEVPEPFGFTVGGEDFYVTDIDDLHWRTVAELRRDDLVGFLRAALADEFSRFDKHRIPLWKVNLLAQQLDEHFGWSAQAGEQGEEDASSTS